ncbi:MAG: helix-turn-helix domain-containing protein [Bdellovibrionales bacterium]|nr:helix-turn-helix domain-containing protein [Bdellovibrionales bacterium]
MRKIDRSKLDQRYLMGLGKHINSLILEKGYKSPYEFWIERVGDDISRASLNYILTGKVDVKATTLRKLASALDVELRRLFDFKY